MWAFLPVSAFLPVVKTIEDFEPVDLAEVDFDLAEDSEIDETLMAFGF